MESKEIFYKDPSDLNSDKLEIIKRTIENSTISDKLKVKFISRALKMDEKDLENAFGKLDKIIKDELWEKNEWVKNFQ